MSFRVQVFILQKLLYTHAHAVNAQSDMQLSMRICGLEYQLSDLCSLDLHAVKAELS